MQSADFFPFIHLQWQLVEQFNVQSTQLIVFAKQRTAKTRSKEKKKKKGMRINVTISTQSRFAERKMKISLACKFIRTRRIKHQTQKWRHNRKESNNAETEKVMSIALSSFQIFFSKCLLLYLLLSVRSWICKHFSEQLRQGKTFSLFSFDSNSAKM